MKNILFTLALLISLSFFGQKSNDRELAEVAFAEIENVKGNSIQDSSIAKNLLDKAKVGDVVTLSNFKMILEKGSKETVVIDSFFMFQIIK